MRYFVTVVAAATAVVAQSNYTSCCSIDPNSVSMDTRLIWCRAQQNTCPTLCADGATASNACDANALTSNCTCLNGPSPNISDYQQSLPAQECREWVKQCVDANPNNLAGQTFCHSFVCGNMTVAAAGSATTSSASSGGASGSQTASTSTSATSMAAAAALQFGREYGTGTLLVGVMAIFGLAL